MAAAVPAPSPAVLPSVHHKPPSSDTFPSPLHIQGKTLTNLLCCLYTKLFPYSASPPLSLPGVFWRRAVQCLPTFGPSLPLGQQFPIQRGLLVEGLSAGSTESFPHREDLALLLGMQGCKPCTSGHAGLQLCVSWACRAAALALQQRCDSAQAGSCCRQGCCSPACTAQCQGSPAQRGSQGCAEELGMLFPAQGQAGPAPTPTMACTMQLKGPRGGCSH